MENTPHYYSLQICIHAVLFEIPPGTFAIILTITNVHWRLMKFVIFGNQLVIARVSKLLLPTLYFCALDVCKMLIHTNQILQIRPFNIYHYIAMLTVTVQCF